MKNLRFAALAIVPLATSCKDDIEELVSLQSVSGSLTSAKVVPGVAVASSARGDISGKYAPASREINYLVAYGGLTGSITAAAFYFGDARHRTPTPVPGFPVASSSSATGQFTGQAILTAQQADSLLAGRLYLNLATTSNPNGEIRATVEVK
jgi:hypothetical protein